MIQLRMEGRWKEDGRRMEGGWKKGGRKMEGVWKELCLVRHSV